MKFAQEFKAAMRSGDYPDKWCEVAIPYPQLKKSLNKIRAELEELGLDHDTLHQLIQAHAVSPKGEDVTLAKYKFSMEETDVKPHLTVWVDIEQGAVVNASLSSATRRFLKKQAALLKQGHDGHAEGGHEQPLGDDPNGGITRVDSDKLDSPPSPASGMQRIELSLHADSEFFSMIQRDIVELDRIGHDEQEGITQDVIKLGKEIELVARPDQKRSVVSKVGKSFVKNSPRMREADLVKYGTDITTWRQIFDLYVRAQVFFSTREIDRNSGGTTRTAEVAARQLEWFQNKVKDTKLLEQLKLRASRDAFDQFMDLNKRLYLNLRFREFNQKAQFKILKKFDKVTALNASKTFPKLLGNGPMDTMVAGMARDVCARIAQDVVAVVPRFEDYQCPVCMSLAYFPIRLKCGHLFCVRCVIKLQRETNECPCCRAPGVREADTSYLDNELMDYMERYFKPEVKEKQYENIMESGREQFGDDFTPGPRCTVM